MGTPTWAAVIGALIRREDLDATSAQWAMGEVMAGNASPAQIAAFAVALRGKGETAAEMSGLAEAMLAAAHRIDVPGPAVDIVGTGGDRSHSVNISTMAALVVAGTGVRVVKHGNRAASSDCGTADVLEELGVALSLTPAQVAAVGADVGITFCFAQVFHPAMRHAAAARREIGVPTSFNFLGPLTNPAQPVAQAIGCADLRMAPVMAQVFAERGASALVFRGDDGLDELTVSTTSSVWRVIDGQVEASTLDPARFAIAAAPIEALRGGDRQHNAGVVRALLSGEERGPIRDAVVLNASAALAALDAATGSGGGGAGAAGGASGGAGAGGAGAATARGALEDAMASGLERAASAIDSGAAADVLDRWVTATQSISS